MRDPLEVILAEAGFLPPEEQEDWDLPPLRGALTRLAHGGI